MSTESNGLQAVASIERDFKAKADDSLNEKLLKTKKLRLLLGGVLTSFNTIDQGKKAGYSDEIIIAQLGALGALGGAAFEAFGAANAAAINAGAEKPKHDMGV